MIMWTYSSLILSTAVSGDETRDRIRNGEWPWSENVVLNNVYKSIRIQKRMDKGLTCY